MKRILYRKKWYQKHRAAHWILSQIAANAIATTTHGITFESRGGKTVFNEENATNTYFYIYPIVSLEQLEGKSKKYNIEILSNAKDILNINGHIDIKKSNQKSIYDTSFCATNEGRIAYEDEYYITEENERIHSSITRVSNWLTPILTLAVASIALFVSCNHNNNSNANTTTTITNPK